MKSKLVAIAVAGSLAFVFSASPAVAQKRPVQVDEHLSLAPDENDPDLIEGYLVLGQNPYSVQYRAVLDEADENLVGIQVLMYDYGEEASSEPLLNLTIPVTGQDEEDDE